MPCSCGVLKPWLTVEESLTIEDHLGLLLLCFVHPVQREAMVFRLAYNVPASRWGW